MNRKPTVAIGRLLVLGLLVWVAISCGRGKLRFDDYASEEQWRTALLQQVPLGSSVEAVIGFLESNDVPVVPQASACGYCQLDRYVIQLGICEGVVQYQVWLIEFQFDENGQLADISVGLYP